ncbi:MAG TPA: type II toxin-antitoxin system VapB family antitoxin [Bauldia sp.]|nr:type II toxin-antitoxin system VapB family antitoxin [Bauldia sp.]
MGISIKNPQVESLIRELAEVTGRGQTEVIGEAVSEMLAREKRKGMADRITALVGRTAPLLGDLDMDEAMYGENGLYDRETGLPK